MTTWAVSYMNIPSEWCEGGPSIAREVSSPSRCHHEQDFPCFTEDGAALVLTTGQWRSWIHICKPGAEGPWPFFALTWLATEGLFGWAVPRTRGLVEQGKVIPSSKEQNNCDSQFSVSHSVGTYWAVTMHSTLCWAWGSGRNNMNSVLGVFSQG